MADKKDVYSRITDKIIADLEQGVRPWMKPWNAEHAAGKITRPLRHNGQPYSGINILNLWMDATDKGFAAPIWMTFNQAKELGGNVRKGERGSLSVYANSFTKTEMDTATGDEVERNIPFMKGYTVFNVDQIDGLPEKYYALAKAPDITPEERIAALEEFFANTGAEIKHGGNQAYYAVSSDHIQMPPFEAFESREGYYATLSHETTHWTRHPTRLERDFGRKRFGDEGYAMEELVAELGSAFLAADLDITPEVREDHAAYIQSWLKVLKEDKKAIFTASAHAQRAAELLHSLQPNLELEATAENDQDMDSNQPEPVQG